MPALLTVRPVSDLNETYCQWTDYPVEIGEVQCRRLVEELQARKHAGREFDVAGVKSQLRDRTGRLLIYPGTAK